MACLKAAALSLLLMPALAAAAEKEPSGPTPLADEKAFAEGALELWKMKDSLQPLVDDIRLKARQLPGLTEQYSRASDLETLARLRDGSAAPVRARMKELGPLWDDYLRASMSLGRMGEMLSLFVLANKRPASDVARGVDIMAAHGRFKFETMKALRETQALLDQEQAAYAKARERIKLSRQRYAILLWLAAAGVAVLAVAVMLRRRGLRLQLEWKTRGN